MFTVLLHNVKYRSLLLKHGYGLLL